MFKLDQTLRRLAVASAAVLLVSAPSARAQEDSTLSLVLPRNPAMVDDIADRIAAREGGDVAFVPVCSNQAPVCGDMTYHNGTVQHGQKIFTIFWQGTNNALAFPSGYQSTINQFITDLNGSSYYNINTQYSDSGTGHIANNSTFGGTWLDMTNAIPFGTTTDPLQSDLQAEIARAITANGWTVNTNSLVLIFTPNTFVGPEQYCGYHTFTNAMTYGLILFPWTINGVGTCFPGGTYPNASATGADAAISVTAHEIFETVTDPTFGGWFFQGGNGEIGDLCAWTFGTRNGTNGSNMSMNGHNYLAQLEYSNASSSCVVGLAGTAATMTSPTPGSTLSGSSVTFNWTAGTGNDQFWLYIGTTGAGSQDVFNQNENLLTSQAVTVLPTNGSTIYVRLYSHQNGNWVFNDYTYTAFSTPIAVMASPTPGSTLSGASVTFTWQLPADVPVGFTTGIAGYYLYVGTGGPGSIDIFMANEGTALSQLVNNIPVTGGTVFVRLWSNVGTVSNPTWLFHDYTYTEATPNIAVLTTPTPSSTISSSPVTFQWTTGTGVSAYYLYVGNTGVGSINLFSANEGTATSQSVAVFSPATIFVRLWSLVSGTWYFHDYTYTSGVPPIAAVMTSPSPGSTFSSQSVTFSWTPGLGNSQYFLYVGNTGVGSSNIFSQNEGTALSQLVNGVPRNGGTVNVRLWSYNATLGGWVFHDYTYTAVSPTRLITAPANHSFLVGNATNFMWSGSADQFYLFVGTTGPGSTDVFSGTEGTANAATISGMPTATCTSVPTITSASTLPGATATISWTNTCSAPTIYVRFWFRTGTTWDYDDYVYSAMGYKLDLGTGAPPNNDLFAGSQQLAAAVGVTSMPTNGSTIQGCIWYLSGGSWRCSEVALRASGAVAGFNTTFNTTGPAVGWTSLSGNWIEDGEYITDGLPLSQGWANVSYDTDFTTFDYSVTMDKANVDGYSNTLWVRGAPGPLGATNGWNNAYFFNYTSTGFMSVWKHVDGVESALQNWVSSGTIVTGGFVDNTLRVIGNGTALSFYINGTLVWSGTDTSLSAGRVGIGSNGGSWFYVPAASLSTTLSSVPQAQVSSEQAALNAAANANPQGTSDKAPVRQ